MYLQTQKSLDDIDSGDTDYAQIDLNAVVQLTQGQEVTVATQRCARFSCPVPLPCNPLIPSWM